MLVPTFFRRRYLAIGFLAVLVPVVVLLAMQYVWLTRLQEMSVIAHRATLRGYLDSVGRQVQHHFREKAGALDVVPSATSEEFRAALHERWQSEPPQGVSRLFVMDFTRATFGNLLFFEPDRDALVSPTASDEALSIIVTCNPWQLDVYRGAATEGRGLVVDERDPERRMLLHPFLDDHDHVQAIVGMILDESWFVEELLPTVARRQLDEHFPEFMRERVTFTVHDGRGDEVLLVRSGHGEGSGAAMDGAATGDGTDGAGSASRQAWSASSLVPFVYTDWTVAIESPGLEVERWARTGFLFNMTVSAVLAMVLLGGVFLALRAANRAVRLSEMKSDFVSNVSHELRTPLASIRAFGEFLKLGRVPTERVREYGEHIESESRRLSRLIDNILDFSRIESGSRTYRFDRADLAEVVQSTVETFQVRTEDGGFRFTLEVPPEELPELDLDVDAIGQVMHNLLDNAVKYSGQSREVEIRLAREGAQAICAVRDHGIGIAADEQRKVFERFHRVGRGLVHDVKGSGLGLSIVQHVVAAHGGAVTVDSELGRGTTVTLRLPVPEDS